MQVYDERNRHLHFSQARIRHFYLFFLCLFGWSLITEMISVLFAVMFFVHKVSYFSGCSDDLSVDLASSLASISSGKAVDGSVDLSVKLAHVAIVKNLNRISFWSEAVLFVAFFSWGGSCGKFSEDLFHSSLVSSAVSGVGKSVKNSLEILLAIVKGVELDFSKKRDFWTALKVTQPLIFKFFHRL